MSKELTDVASLCRLHTDSTCKHIAASTNLSLDEINKFQNFNLIIVAMIKRQRE